MERGRVEAETGGGRLADKHASRKSLMLCPLARISLPDMARP